MQAAATPFTPATGATAGQFPSPLRRRGYFTDVQAGGGAFSRMPSLFSRPEAAGDGGKAAAGSSSLPQQAASPEAYPSPTTVCKDKLHRSFQLAKLQVNRDLEPFIEEARRAAAEAAAAEATIPPAHASSAAGGAGGAGSSSAAATAATAAAVAACTDAGDVGSLERIVMIAERCLEEDVASFRDSIQAIVDQVEVRGSC